MSCSKTKKSLVGYVMEVTLEPAMMVKSINCESDFSNFNGKA